jgi:hypothetical protein
MVEESHESYDDLDEFDQGHEEIHLNLEGFEPERPLPPADDSEQPHNG